MGMGFAPTWLCQVSPSPMLHKTTLTTALATAADMHAGIAGRGQYDNAQTFNWCSRPIHILL